METLDDLMSIDHVIRVMDDHTLTSGAGIGEPTYCDGRCQG